MHPYKITILTFCLFFLTVVSQIHGQLMITQTYRTGNVDLIQLEIKNISGQAVTQDFYLVKFQGNTNKPKSETALGNFSIEQVKIIDQEGFNDKGIFAISSSTDINSYADRIDVIGTINVNWDIQGGLVKSLTRGTCASTTPNITYNPADWIFLDIAEVQSALPDQNIKNGIYNSGASVWNGTSWLNGTPDRTRRVEINQSYTSPAPIVACDLVVNANLNFDHGSNGSIEVFRNLSVNSNVVFTVGDTESLLTYNNSAVISGNITKKEKTTSLARIYDATYWSSPVQNASLSTAFAGVNQTRIFTLRPESAGPYAGIYKFWHLASGTMERGRGYSAEGKSTGINEFSFTGNPNNGSISKAIVFNPGTDPDYANNDANLIGNPYPSAIDPDIFIPANTGVFDGAIYVWRHQQDVVGGHYQQADYMAYTLAGGQGSSFPDPYYIASAQGFMINATSNGNIQFNNGMRVKGNNSYFYKGEINKGEITTVSDKDRMWLALSDGEEVKKEIMIGFFKEATTAFDAGYDAPSWKGDGLQWYSLIGQDRFGIQALDSFDDDKAVPLGLQVAEQQDLTIEISRSEGALKEAGIFLVDHFLLITHDLSKGAYTFRQDTPAEVNNRFTIEFKAKTVAPELPPSDNRELIISQKQGEIHLKSAQIISNLKIFDIQGRILINVHPQAKDYRVSVEKMKSGSPVILNVMLENRELISRKLIIY